MLNTEDAGQLEVIAVGNASGSAALEGSLAVSYRVKHIPTMNPAIPLLDIYKR